MAIAVLAAYAGIYYLSARRLLSELRGIDHEYLKYLGAHGGIGASNSMAIIKLLFDSGIPKPSYPASFRRRLKMVRTMLFVSPLVFLVVFII